MNCPIKAVLDSASIPYLHTYTYHNDLGIIILDEPTSGQI